MHETLEPSSSSPPEPAALDAADVRAACDGDRGAFDRLVLRHQQAVLNTAFYLLSDYQDALEVAQETFLKAYRGLAGFRSEASFRTWILRITTNSARSLRSRMRAKKRSANLVSLSAEADDRPALEVADRRETDPAALLQRKEVKEALEEAIASLDPQYREIVVLRDISGESYEAISESLGVPLGTVKSKIHRARLQLREAMTPLL